MSGNSIFDKIVESQKVQEASSFSPGEFVNELLKTLNEKEREILIRRYGLNNNQKQTLEEIGKAYNITRERIRQIQTLGVKKLKALDDFVQRIQDINHLVQTTLTDHGGVMEHDHLIDELLTYSESNETNQLATAFILNQLLDDVDLVRPNEYVREGWQLKNSEIELLMQSLQEIENLLKAEKKLYEMEELLGKVSELEFFRQNIDRLIVSRLGEAQRDINKIITAHLTLSQRIDPNILGQWGLNSWTTVRPKRMADKIYLIFQREKKPLHFAKIADLINQAKFDKKIARPATIHNELILDKRFVLVGRGIYALAEWGYSKGTVADVITAILKASGRPMSRDEITKAVLEQRLVKKSTIYLALTDKTRFSKTKDGTYQIAQ